jgi:hypothetical protein
MDWKSKMQSVRDLGQSSLDHGARSDYRETMATHTAIVPGKGVPAALAAAHDNGKMERLFKLIYAALPFPV